MCNSCHHRHHHCRRCGVLLVCKSAVVVCAYSFHANAPGFPLFLFLGWPGSNLTDRLTLTSPQLSIRVLSCLLACFFSLSRPAGRPSFIYQFLAVVDLYNSALRQLPAGSSWLLVTGLTDVVVVIIVVVVVVVVIRLRRYSSNCGNNKGAEVDLCSQQAATRFCFKKPSLAWDSCGVDRRDLPPPSPIGQQSLPRLAPTVVSARSFSNSVLLL
ncbi:hypothetical protein T4B_7619 [Trichinella pseudospiralis]|uniref:Uncharacterized protein n=1 Tax=Trichinella pseudospiralis TaxID=6337 RepID=A0A0V1IEZ8_TRIPS|nr:hypothetical protein T4B_7619 [Trichinella pseudospiralis]